MPASDTPNAENPVRACVAYDRSGRRVGDIALEAISDMLALSDRFVWVGLYEPDAALLAQMQHEFDLHPLAVEDAAKAHQRPKLEAYGESLFVVARTASRSGAHVRFGETHIFMGRNYILTIRHGDSTGYTTVRRNAEQTPALLAQGPGYALYAVLDAIVDGYLPIVEAYRAELEELEGEIFARQWRRGTLKRLYAMQRELTRLRLAVAPLQDVLAQLQRLPDDVMPEAMRPYFRDVNDHANRINDTVGALREMLSAAMNVSVSLVTLEQNEVVKRLAGWAALLAVPTLLTGWFGMNFRHMPELDWRWSYPALLVFTLALCGGLYYWLKRSRWL
ncbi:MAG: magnesium/cobalt transporter CorA [Thiomonas arsenitoxydans]|uniref:Magnesium transport protein CorA n=1 Tax=Thiomonas arsenitoxydans (strain DSM 22701 / CIP 110005 / 3As) TaxID=426114 RepID=A0A8I1SUC8_THIA3|nr:MULTISPECIES: magnesium/cobalt transporter CorA [Thiomonas]MBN8742942.1 magnesium/cobalt transporter CorA [Thiomonas arsenitoxydans]ODU97519.1 MAG: magnesium and cobalt transport protein CorA [Thiomonas sp. SCN 64-16]